MAQGIKKFVVKSINDGDSVKSILNEVVTNKECNWLDTVSTFLWWCWFKFIKSILEWVGIVLGVILWVFCCSVIAAVCAVIAAVVLFVSSPIWMPIRLWKAPQKVAKLLLNTGFKDLDEPKETPFVAGSNFWYGGVKVINWVWKPIYSLLPMSRRKFFIDEDSRKLESYPTEVQVAYYDAQIADNKEVVLKEMSGKAGRQVWNRGELKDREHCLNAWIMPLDDYKLLFENEDKSMFKLLKLYCANKEKQVDAKLQRYFVEQLAGERSDRAYEVLKVCALTDGRTFEAKTLTDLISMFSGEHGEQACEILTLYKKRCTLPSEVVEALIKAATADYVDDGRRRAYELLKKVVRRNGITTELAELFFAHCGKDENEAVTEILNEQLDKQLINWECISETDKGQFKKLADYFAIRKEVSVEGQKLLREWQYVLYRRTNHKLDDEVISYLLVKHLKEDDLSYFMQVLDEAEENNALSATDIKLMKLTKWKRDILINRLAKKEKDKEIATL